MLRRCKFLQLFLCALMLLVSSSVHAEGAPPNFTLSTLDGSSVSLSDYLGKQTVVLNFFAAWCVACEEEVPELIRLKNAGGAVFIGVNAGDSKRAAQKFVDRTKYPFLVVMDADKSVAKFFGVMGVPQTIVIAKSGAIVYSGAKPPEKLPAP